MFNISLKRRGERDDGGGQVNGSPVDAERHALAPWTNEPGVREIRESKSWLVTGMTSRSNHA